MAVARRCVGAGRGRRRRLKGRARGRDGARLSCEGGGVAGGSAAGEKQSARPTPRAERVRKSLREWGLRPLQLTCAIRRSRAPKD